MIIHDGFYLNGFTRMDKGEAGAVFVRYAEEDEDKRKPEIKETPMYYGGADTMNFTLTIPKPRPRKMTACAIVTRSSKNCYSATVFDERRIETFKESSLNDLRTACAAFFAGVKR